MNIIMKKAFIKKLILLVLILTSAFILLSCKKALPPERFVISYTATAGGYISGETNQYVEKGGEGSIVTAVTDEGYVFTRWSDGNTNTSRQEINLQTDIFVIANFEIRQIQVTDYYTLSYGVVTNNIAQTVANYPEFTFIQTSDSECDVRLSDKTIAKAVIPEKVIISNIEYTVTSVAMNSFSSAANLEKVRLPRSIKTIGQAAFMNCKNLKSITLPAVETIGTNAFAMTDLEYLIIPDTATTVAATILRGNSTKVYVRAPLPFGATVPGAGWTVTWNGNNSNTVVDYNSDFIPAECEELSGGAVNGEAAQTVEYGGRGTEVIAAPNEGYVFIGWSDGIKTTKRTDNNITANINVTAEFEEMTYAVTYSAGTGGMVTGITAQKVKPGWIGAEVIAEPNEEYVFTGWSDGIKTAKRTETNVTINVNVIANYEKIKHTVTYSAGVGGTITGATTQTVAHGESGTKVTAMPNAGYLFFKWSDGIMTAERTDTNVTAAINVTAEFKLEGVIFSVSYRAGAGGRIIGETSQTIEHRGNAATVKAESDVSYRFVKWSDGVVTTNRTDKDVTTNLSVTAEFELITYKILMVFVDEIHATLKNIQIDYKMSAIERQICELISVEISKVLNEWFDGLVIFEIDSYFTTVTLGSESFNIGGDTCSIMAYNIPEISGILNNYRSIITTLNMNDYDGLLHNAAGLGEKKYAAVFMEAIFKGLLVNHDPIESLLDLTNPNWNSILTLYLHEFTHTIEQGLKDVYEYHKAHISSDYIEITRLYLLNQLVIDGKEVGIPYSYWKDEVV